MDIENGRDTDTATDTDMKLKLTQTQRPTWKQTHVDMDIDNFNTTYKETRVEAIHFFKIAFYSRLPYFN
jgi:predicted solute-binding protein